MTKNRLIFYSIFAGFHLFLVIFAFYVESQRNDFAFLTKMLGWISLMKWGALLGLGLLITDLVWSFTVVREYKKENGALTHEINTLKAKLFDLQEAAKNPPPHNPNVGR